MASLLLLVAALCASAQLSLAAIQESCDHGALKVDKVCVGQCVLNSTCRCTAVTGSSLEHCVEYCLDSECPEMYCTGGKTCKQYCRQASNCRGMECTANEISCEQNCSESRQCGVLKCSSKSCKQSCSNCTMICTSEVEHCEQSCHGGECNIKCDARNCRPKCASNGTECNVDVKGGFNGAMSHVTYSLSTLLLQLLVGYAMTCFA